jgi:homoserine O-acetyltransferase
MGCMHAFVWGEAHPDFAQALMPLACEPVEIAGANRMWRQMSIDAIKSDPAWQKGDYESQPLQGLRTAGALNIVAGSAPINWQTQYPTRVAAAAYAQERMSAWLKTADANDYVYQLDASRNYNPWAKLKRITAPMMWINSADDFINPRNLPFPEQAVKRMPNAQFRLIPETADTMGHGTHTWAKFWKGDLADLLARSESRGH